MILEIQNYSQQPRMRYAQNHVKKSNNFLIKFLNSVLYPKSQQLEKPHKTHLISKKEKLKRVKTIETKLHHLLPKEKKNCNVEKGGATHNDSKYRERS